MKAGTPKWDWLEEALAKYAGSFSVDHHHARWVIWRSLKSGLLDGWVWCACDNLYCVLERVRQRRHYTQHAVSQGCAASIREQLEVLDARGIVTATEEDPVLPCGDDGSLRIHTPHPEI